MIELLVNMKHLKCSALKRTLNVTWMERIVNEETLVTIN